MNRKGLIAEYTAFVSFLGINPRDFVVSHGGALCMFGIKTITDDIDVSVPPLVWDKILKSDLSYKLVYLEGVGDIIRYSNIDIHLQDDFYSFDRDVTIIDGVAVTGLHQILFDYRQLNREKDQVWIKKLECLTS